MSEFLKLIVDDVNENHLKENKNPLVFEETLRQRVISVIEKQGFSISQTIIPVDKSKETYKLIQIRAKKDQMSRYKEFILNNISLVQLYIRDGREIDPHSILLELREIYPGSEEEIIFRWWNLVWWSMPFQRSYGRQMRFLLWDVYHDAPFGLFLLQSPVLKMSVRDKYLEIPREELDLWINKSMYAQRIGAFPPYNELIGGKMVALSITSNEIRNRYREKYKNSRTLLRGRIIEPDLLFITTTSAFGKSSIYNRLKYKGEVVAESLGYTRGSGTFHIPEDIYLDMIKFLEGKGINTSRGYGNGPSRKLKLISLAFKYLGLPKFEYHGIRREFFLFPLVSNLKKVIKFKEEPIYVNRPFEEMAEYWKKRWALPRSERKFDWKKFKGKTFLNEVEKMYD